ncbi:ERCC1 [Hepatospora eriocheir]|uniref:ERCC1 n=1 Tax=Hepatospora eriocheir TaxID=1081669 RepID=A0A1X0QF91_9MICR|nr:ERCC1 [Hepatospora eriocheir]
MIKVSSVQKGNVVISYLKQRNWQYDHNITCDYEINKTIGVLFLSLKYHVTKPEYVLKRLLKLNKSYRIKILMIHVDVPNYNSVIKPLYDHQDVTIILCKNQEECVEYIKNFEKSNEGSSEILRNKESSIERFLLDIPKVTQSEVNRIRSKYTNLISLMNSKETELTETFGVGKRKAKSILDIFNKKFINK